MATYNTIIERLASVRLEAEKMMKIAGTPGAAISVIHEGTLIHSAYIGQRDIEKNLPVNEETIFPCASLTKAVVSAAVALTIEDGAFGWDTPVKDILPDFHTRDDTLHQLMTPVDCLSHRAGMQSSLYWLGSQNNVLISEENSMNLINDLQRYKGFRDEYLYNNLGYEIAAHLLTRASGEPWAQVLHKRIFEPLHMTRTGTHAYFINDDNVAKTYGTLDDASNIEVTPMLSGDNTVGGPGSAMRSCTKDLIKLYTSFLEAGRHQFDTGSTETPGSPLRQVPFLWSSKITMNSISFHETTYALGWARVQTPGPMGAIGLNPDLLKPKPMPQVAQGHPSTLLLYHQGCMPGNLAFIVLIPETRGAVLVLTNSSALNDTADWLGQLYLEAYLGVIKKNDYLALAKETAANALKWYPRLVDELERTRIPNTRSREYADYTGTFYNDARTMMIKIFLDPDGSLQLSFQGLENEKFGLTHYNYDVFTWLVTRNEFARRARFPNFDAQYPAYFKISFYAHSETNLITYLTWWHDRWLPEPERFTKE